MAAKKRSPGYFLSKVNWIPNLVVDVTGGIARAGTGLQVWRRNSPASANQLWKFVPAASGAPIAQGYIQNLLSPNLVVDVTGGSRAIKGTRTCRISLPAPSNNDSYSRTRIRIRRINIIMIRGSPCERSGGSESRNANTLSSESGGKGGRGLSVSDQRCALH
jgi:hypothetical protein